MPIYQYEAKTLQGNILKGTMEAIDENTVRSNLREKSYYPQNVKVYNEALNVDLSKYAKVPLKSIAIFCRQFSFTLSAGMNILKSMDVVTEQTENKKLKSILRSIKTDLEKGSSLSESMKKNKEMPEMLVNMVEVGESSGNLDNVMIRMADYYDNSYKLNKKIKGSLTYPGMIAVVSVIVVNLLVIFVLPTFVGMITSSGGELPLPTRIVMRISNFMGKYGLILLLGTILLIILFRMYIKANDEIAEEIDRTKLKIPIFGQIFKQIDTARFARTFSTLMSSGMPVLSSIDICSRVADNILIKNVLRNTSEDIRKGSSIGMSLEAQGVFPTMLTQMIVIGEETGTLDSIMEKTAQFYDNEVETATQQLSSLIEPVIIVVLAVVVGFIVIAMLLPMFSMYDAISNT
jgi:type IV pilus assembly protein PilC